MAKTYLLTAWRNLIRRKNYTLINIVGLGVALGACLVIFVVEYHEFSYDRYHRNAGRIYQLVKDEKMQNEIEHEVGIPFEATAALRHDFPQIRFAECYVMGETQVTVMKADGTASEKKFIEDRDVYYADPEMFRIFDVTWLDGDAAVLKDDNTAVLTQSVAQKYFGNWREAMGKYIQIEKGMIAKVAGVIGDPPPNTDFAFRLILSYRTFLANHAVFGYDYLDGWQWSVSNHQVYALLPERVAAGAINRTLPGVVAKYFKPDPSMGSFTYFLRPLSDVHFDTRFENNGDHATSKTSLYTLALIGLLILCMACINFINLTTALAIRRSREVGIRKILGSGRPQLVLQMLTDTGLLVAVAMAAGILLAQVCLPFVKYIFPIVTPVELLTWSKLPYIIGLWLGVTLLAGLYPAYRLSRFNPIEAVRYRTEAPRGGGAPLRRVLVVVQFAFSQLLIVATLVVVSQMSYIRNADMGVTRETVMLLKGKSDSSFYARQFVIKQELLKLPDVQAVSLAFDAPPSGNTWNNDFTFDSRAKPEPFNAKLKFGDADYARTFGLKMAAGSWYSADDTTATAVINEAMVRRLGLSSPEQAVGRRMRIGEGPLRRITGVAKDFKNASLKEEVPPNIIVSSKRFHSMTAIRLKTKNPGRSMAEIESVWNRIYPEYAMKSTFMDEDIAKFYVEEQRLSLSFKAYMLLAVLISSLGLYGLVSFMAVQRTKEVGIRKVLGATVAHIIYLFSREFTVLVVVAFLIAGPVGWYVMKKWLENFVYSVKIGPQIFISTFLLSMGIALLTVGYKSIRAALANPAESLRAE